MSDLHDGVIAKLYRDRPLAHQFLFKKRHQNRTPAFHAEIIRDLHDASLRNLCEIGFRGSAKSTLLEEAVTLGACFREFKNCLIVGAAFRNAQERVHAIRRQFENNETLRELFGDLVGQPWGDDKLETTTGIVIAAMGRGQAIRGTKSEDFRPDLIVCDDIEDKESLRTAEGREKVQNWLFTELLPAGDEPNLRTVMLSNDQHPECIANKLKHADSGFTVRIYPWEYQDPVTGARTATWPDRFPLKTIDAKRRQLYALGRAAEYEQEYMCRSEVAADKTFKPEMLRVEPRVRSWQAVYAMIDPARTVNAKSATTGYAAWSWIGPKLVVWDAWGRFLLPNEIIDALFEIHEQFHPVLLGFEKDGLDQWALQPIRQEQVRRGVLLPLEGVKAPVGKNDFIRGLQPFFSAREIEFAQELPDLKAQLLGFPAGRIDVPNALAYALKLRPGAPVYDEFQPHHILDGLEPQPGLPGYLVLNATGALLTAVLVQHGNGAWRVLADWVREGELDQVLGDVVHEANLECQRIVRLIAGPRHFERYNNVGLVQAAKRLPMEVRRAVEPERGRATLQDQLRRYAHGTPALLVADRARWTLNAFAGGYCREVLKTGQLSDYAKEGVYRLLMESLEGFLGLFRTGSTDDEDSGINWAHTRDGRPFISARAQRG